VSSPLMEAAHEAVRAARKLGASEVAVSVSRSRQVEVSWRDGRVETVSEATTRGMGVDLYVDGRFSSVSTSDLRPEALQRLLAEGVALTRTLAPDPFRRLPEPELYQGAASLDLELADPDYDALDATARRRAAQQAEEAARSVKDAGRIVSVSVSVGDTSAERVLLTSNGFEGVRRGTDYGIAAEAPLAEPSRESARSAAPRPIRSGAGRSAR
jgi:PmbA protein